jgi:hypothetical protein
MDRSGGSAAFLMINVLATARSSVPIVPRIGFRRTRTQSAAVDGTQ